MSHTFQIAPYGLWLRLETTKLGWSMVAPESPATGLAGAFLSLDNGWFMVGWFDGRISTLVHECVHAAEDILRYVGVPPKGEALAYLTEYLFTEARKCTSTRRASRTPDRSVT